MDFDETPESTETSFGKEVTKAFVLSAAATAGTWAGIIVIGFAVEKFQDMKEKRKTKKEASTEN